LLKNLIKNLNSLGILCDAAIEEEWDRKEMRISKNKTYEIFLILNERDV